MSNISNSSSLRYKINPLYKQSRSRSIRRSAKVMLPEIDLKSRRSISKQPNRTIDTPGELTDRAYQPNFSKTFVINDNLVFRSIVKPRSSIRVSRKKEVHELDKLFIFDSTQIQIKQLLLKKGWKQNDNRHSRNFLLKWVECPTLVDFEHIKPKQFLNHIKNNDQLTNLSKLHQNLKDKPYWRNKIYQMNTQFKEFQQDFRRNQILILLKRYIDFFSVRTHQVFKKSEKSSFQELLKNKSCTSNVPNRQKINITLVASMCAYFENMITGSSKYHLDEDVIETICAYASIPVQTSQNQYRNTDMILQKHAREAVYQIPSDGLILLIYRYYKIVGNEMTTVKWISEKKQPKNNIESIDLKSKIVKRLISPTLKVPCRWYPQINNKQFTINYYVLITQAEVYKYKKSYLQFGSQWLSVLELGKLIQNQYLHQFILKEVDNIIKDISVMREVEVGEGLFEILRFEFIIGSDYQVSLSQICNKSTKGYWYLQHYKQMMAELFHILIADKTSIIQKHWQIIQFSNFSIISVQKQQHKTSQQYQEESETQKKIRKIYKSKKLIQELASNLNTKYLSSIIIGLKIASKVQRQIIIQQKGINYSKIRLLEKCLKNIISAKVIEALQKLQFLYYQNQDGIQLELQQYFNKFFG